MSELSDISLIWGVSRAPRGPGKRCVVLLHCWWVKSQLTKMAALTQEVSQEQKNSALIVWKDMDRVHVCYCTSSTL